MAFVDIMCIIIACIGGISIGCVVWGGYNASVDHSRCYLIRVINKNNIKDYIIHSEDDNKILRKFIKNKTFPISVDAEYLEEDEILEFFPQVADVAYRFSYSINSWLRNNNTTVIYFYKLPNTIQTARLYYTTNMLPTKNKIKKIIEEK